MFLHQIGFRINEARRFSDRRSVELDGPAAIGSKIEVEGDGVRISSKQAPAYEHLPVTLIDSDHAATAASPFAAGLPVAAPAPDDRFTIY